MRLRYEKCMKSRVFTDPLRRIRDMDVTVDSYIQRLENKMKIIHKDSQSSYIKLVSKLDTLSPLKTLTRGYSLTEKDNKIVKSAKELEKDDKVKLKFSDGEKRCDNLLIDLPVAPIICVLKCALKCAERKK